MSDMTPQEAAQHQAFTAVILKLRSAIAGTKTVEQAERLGSECAQIMLDAGIERRAARVYLDRIAQAVLKEIETAHG